MGGIMKSLFRPLPLFFLASAAALVPVSAQTAEAAPSRITVLAERYQSGVALMKEGKADEALSVFLGIIKDEPKAKGSLWWASIIELQEGHADKALEHLNQFTALLTPDDPNYGKALSLLIQANQALGRDVRVEQYRKQLYAIHAGTTSIPGLTDAKEYVREQMPQEKGGRIELNEFFDYHKEAPNVAWYALDFDETGHVARYFLVYYSADQTAALRAKNPGGASTEVFLFGENVIKDNKVAQFNLYRELNALPAYNDFRQWTLDAIKNPPKPIFVQTFP